MQEDNEREEPLAMNTGNSLSTAPELQDSPLLRRSLEVDVTGSPLVQQQQSPTFGRMRRPSMGLDSNMEPSQLTVVQIRIGKPSETVLNVENWTLSRQTFMCEVISHSKELPQIICNLLLKNEQYIAFGEPQELESQEERGMKRHYKRTQRILAANFGMATWVKNTLLWMNSVEGLTSVTYSDGSTDIQLLWKLRDQAPSLKRRLFG